jgi:hypothetical protein
MSVATALSVACTAAAVSATARDLPRRRCASLGKPFTLNRKNGKASLLPATRSTMLAAVDEVDEKQAFTELMEVAGVKHQVEP